MKRLGRWLIYSTLFSAFILCLTADYQAQTHAIKHFGLDKNIFPSRIECLAQAPSGELLIGTLAGLVVYNGYEFNSYDVNHGLAESSISHIYVDGETIWLGHWTGSISKFNISTKEVEVLAYADKFNYASIVKMIRGISGEMIVLTKDGSLYTLAEGSVERMVLNTAENDKVIDVFFVQSDLHVITDSQIVKHFTNAEGEKVWQSIYTSNNLSIVAANWWREQTWLIAHEDNIEIIDISTRKQHLEALTNNLALSGIANIARDAMGNYWISTDNMGVVQIDVLNQKALNIERSNGLSYNQVKSVFVDREGIVWIATSAGLDQYLGNAFMLYDARSSIKGNIVWDIEIFDKRMYVCTSDGISICELPTSIDDLKVERYIETPGIEIKQIVFDGYDQLWVLDHSGGVWQMKTSESSLQKTNAIGHETNCIEIVNGELWLGTDVGIFVINNGNGRPVEHLTTETGLAGNRITGIYYSRLKNETWVTALGSQTIRYKDSKFKRYGQEEGLQTSVIQDATFDNDGNIWFASYDNGVFHLKDDSFHALGEQVKLTSETTFSIEIDERGTVWVGHNWGVDSYLPALDMHETYGEDEGFMGVEINPGAMTYHPSAGLWMGTLMGVLGFNPDRIKPNPFEPTLKIHKALLGNIDLLDSARNDALLNVNSDLTVDFKSVSLVNPEKNTFHYRLVGAHENWREIEKPGPVEYLSLPMGEFNFELKACNSSGVCKTMAPVVEFVIAPPFYRTWWFYTLIFLIVVVIIFFMDQYRVVSLLEEKSKIQEKLDLKDQKLIEVDQEKQRLISQNKLSNRFIEAIQTIEQEEYNLAGEILLGFRAHHLKLGTVNSNGVFTHLKKQLKGVFILEIGSVGPSAHAIRTELKLKVYQKFVQVNTPEQGLKEWLIIVNSLEKSLPQFSGINWFVCFEGESQKKYATHGMKVYKTDHRKVELLEEQANQQANRNASSELFSLPSNGAFIVASGGFFEQLNEGGTKAFSEKSMMKSLEKSVDQPQEVIAKGVFDAFDQWRGGMEQFQDVSLFIWNHD